MTGIAKRESMAVSQKGSSRAEDYKQVEAL